MWLQTTLASVLRYTIIYSYTFNKYYYIKLDTTLYIYSLKLSEFHWMNPDNAKQQVQTQNH